MALYTPVYRWLLNTSIQMALYASVYRWLCTHNIQMALMLIWAQYNPSPIPRYTKYFPPCGVRIERFYRHQNMDGTDTSVYRWLIVQKYIDSSVIFPICVGMLLQYTSNNSLYTKTGNINLPTISCPTAHSKVHFLIIH